LRIDVISLMGTEQLKEDTEFEVQLVKDTQTDCLFKNLIK